MASVEEAFENYLSKHFGSIKEDDVDKMFDKFDKDGNGFIEKTELDAFLKDIYSQQPDSESTFEDFSSGLMAKLDQDDDIKIDRNELRAILPTQENFLKQFQNTTKTKICGVDFLKIWNHYDVNRNGTLEGKEIDDFLRDLILKCKPNTTRDKTLDVKIANYKAGLLKKFGIESKETGEKQFTKCAMFHYFSVDGTCPGFECVKAEEFEEIFSTFDKDNSGVIELNELTELLLTLKLTDGGDGITKEDITGYASTIMAKFDKNNDKKIQKSELKEFFNIKE